MFFETFLLKNSQIYGIIFILYCNAYNLAIGGDKTMDTEETVVTKKKINAGKVFKITFKTVILGISLFIYGFFMFRLCTMDDPKEMQKILWNDVNRAAYAADPAGFEAYDQEPDTIITPNGTFWISGVVHLPDANQIQITIKFNDSTRDHLKEWLKKKELADDSFAVPEEPFDYSLIDNNGVRYHPSSVATATKQNYNYRRLVFENIDMNTVTDLYADMYYLGDIDYAAAPYGSLKVWDSDLPVKVHNVKKDLPDDLK